MSADLSRVRFDPLRNHSGIGIQQGRLWLDADFNEQVAITGRRARAQTVDLSPTPITVSRLTPQAFEITAAGGALAIGAGRMYVDGLLAENHGVTRTFDPILAESNGTGAIDYLEQPYWPTPDQLPGGGPHLIYLDVWERELDHITTPDLVDPAVGVDTTTRTQTIWQVRLLAAVAGDATCDSDIPAWTSLTTPSSARLTTGTVDVDTVDDPCEIPPGKGYRGPENQLYRVELLSPTAFAWSRDNATVASSVAEVLSATSLRLESLGRDDVLRIKENDWVEITDDRRELNQLAGDLRQVSVDVATSTITFTPALTDLATGAVHLRARKWDSAAITIPTDGSPITLEYGVTITFSFVADGAPHTGDHWVFAARATAPTPAQSLELLVEAPPRGIHHHYARLALVTLPGTVNSDCRPTWPVSGEGRGHCGCEICVTAQDHNAGTLTIQDAIDRLKRDQGGTVRLCPGAYRIDKPLNFSGARSITLCGAGNTSRLVSDGTAIAVFTSVDITLEHFAVTNSGEAPSLLLVDATRDCRLGSLALDQKEGVTIGLGGVHEGLAIQDCAINGSVGIGVIVADTSLGHFAGVISHGPAHLLTDRLTISGNSLDCSERGISLGGICQLVGPTLITCNTIRGCGEVGINVTGLIPHDGDTVNGTLEICGNMLDITGSGIRTGNFAHIRANTVNARGRSVGQYGIVLDAGPPDTGSGVAWVLANEVTGFANFGIMVTAQVLTVQIASNVVRGTGGGIAVLATASGGAVTVGGNAILNLSAFPGAGRLLNASAASSEEPAPTYVPASSTPTFAQFCTPFATTSGVSLMAAGVLGIVVAGADIARITGNTIDGITTDTSDGGRAGRAYGILVHTCTETTIAQNIVSRIGSPASLGGDAVGILAASWQDTLTVSDNVVLSGTRSAPGIRPGWTAIELVGGVEQRSGALRSVRTTSATWTFVGDLVYRRDVSVAHAIVTGNALQGGGEGPSLVVSIDGDMIMSSNRCTQPGPGRQQVARAAAGSLIVQGNRLIGGDPSMTITVPPGAVAVLGNISSGGIQINGTMSNATDPWTHLNPSE